MRDKNPDCPPDDPVVTLRFVYEHHEYDGDLFAQLVEHLDITLFDVEGNYAGHHEVSVSALSDNTFSFTIDPGIYSAVIWGNSHTAEYNLTRGNTRNADMKLELSMNNGTVEEHPGNLFHGAVSFEAVKAQTMEKTVSMIKNTNRIRAVLNFSTDPLPWTRSGDKTNDRVAVRIEAANAVYGHDNSILDTQSFIYVPVRSKIDDDTVYDDFQILRIPTGAGHEIYMTVTDLENPTYPLYRIELVDWFSKYYDLKGDTDFDRKDFYGITFDVNRKPDGSLTVQVSDWDDINSGGEL